MSCNIDFPKIIKKLRKTAGLSQQDLAQIIQKDQATVSRIEHGTQHPDLKTIFVIANYFEVEPQDFLIGRINFWTIAEKFGVAPKVDPKYLANQNSVVREIIPLMKFIVLNRGADFLEDFLKSFGLIDLVLMNANYRISSFIYFDLLESAIERGILQESNIKDLVHLTQSQEYHDQFYNIYKSHEDPFDVIRTYSLNGYFYEGILVNKVSNQEKNSMTLSYNLRSELKENDFSKNNLSEFIVALKETQIGSIPQYFCNKSVLTKSNLVEPRDFTSGFEINVTMAS